MDARMSHMGTDAVRNESDIGPRFILALWCDLSLTTGYSINERESAVALLDSFPGRVRVVCPYPASPETFYDPRVDYVYNHRRHHPLHYPRFVLSQRRRIRELIDHEGASAVIFRIGAFPLTAALTVRAGTPVILKGFRGDVPRAVRGHQWMRRISSFGVEKMYEYITRQCLGADVQSVAYAKWLAERFPQSADKMTIISNGANTEAFIPQDRLACRRRYGWDRFRHLVGYVGAIDELRCVSALVGAARQLRDVPGLGMVIVGKGPLMEPLKARTRAEGLADRVLFPGFLPYDEIPDIMGSFNVAVDLTRVEFKIGEEVLFGSYSQKIAQYLACGIPVVAWDTPDTRYLEEERVGRTVPVDDESRLAGVLREMLVGGPESVLEAKSIRAFACRELATTAIARKRIEYWEKLTASSHFVPKDEVPRVGR